MIERIKAIIVVLPLLGSIASAITGFAENNGLFMVASALFFLAFVMFVKNTYGTK